MHAPTTRIVVIGNGMVGHRFCEALRERDTERRFSITVFGEEPRHAYNRVLLTSYFSGTTVDELSMSARSWYDDEDITLHTGDPVVAIDRGARVVRSANGREVAYDQLVLAMGSAPFVPGIPGIRKEGVFTYRTIEDLDAIIAYGANCKTATVIGGGLLGLEAAKAVHDMGLKTRVVEFAPRLMPRQLDAAGSEMLVRAIEAMGVEVCLGCATQEVLGNGHVTGLRCGDAGDLDADLIVVSAGIRPRDELARACELVVGARGGIEVDDTLATNDPHIFAIGEVALHRGMIYGLVAPGYEMVDTLVARMFGEAREFTGADLSTKLKLMGIEVACVGDPVTDQENTRIAEVRDPVAGVYKKLVLAKDEPRVIAALFVGDASRYGETLQHARSGAPLTLSPHELLSSKSAAASPAASSDAGALICSCNNVTRGQICSAIREAEVRSVGELKQCTKAGTGCGGCLPLVKDILEKELQASGYAVNKAICEHFAMSRQELLHVIKVKELRTFDEVIAECGKGHGCEICKPVVASILASVWNEHIVKHAAVQDTNDRFLANIQRGGTYSVIPRVPGGEITPEKLIVIGEVAKKYSLYCKITGGQRIDLLGARVEQLPDIWEELIAAGFESGHAYGKAVRTVKSCVGSVWCRFGVQDSTAFAIAIEERYRGIRAPHKIKLGVSGCVRECAEARGKDIGLIATEQGWNLYICGNGGSKPRHADLFASDLDEATATRYMDRLLMYYIKTADPLTRTSTWLDKIEGGIEHLREVVLKDSLGICETLEAEMEALVGSYECEWKAVIDNPKRRATFTHFAGSTKPDSTVTFVEERGQIRPPEVLAEVRGNRSTSDAEVMWWNAGPLAQFPKDSGIAVDYDGVQLAVFNFGNGKWYATQNMCPHRQEMVLARGLTGDVDGEPKVACPMHKKQFSLETGACMTDAHLCIRTFDVKVENGDVYLQVPPVSALESLSPACATAGVA